MIENGSDSSSEVDEGSKNYLPNRSETITEQGAGTIIPEESSISVVLTNYIYYDEDELKAQGALDDMTFDEFVAQNRGRQQVQADAALYDSVSKATGIATDNISILCYEEPFFQASSNNGNTVDNDTYNYCSCAYYCTPCICCIQKHKTGCC